MSARGGVGGAPEAHDVEAVSECVDLLHGASAKVQLYGPLHPQTGIAITAFVERLHDILEWVGPLVFETSTKGLVWRGQVVSREGDDRVGLGRHVHAEGVSLLALNPGIRDDEVHRLLGVLRVNLSLPAYEEETLESLLYQAEFENVAFTAISELMDAEALSGREDDHGLGKYISDQLVDSHPGDLEKGRKFSAALSPDDVVGGDIVDQWDLDVAIDIENVSDDEWRERFAKEAGDDLEAIDALRHEVRFERSSQLLSRLVMILLRAHCAGRPEVAESATGLAVAVMRELYALGDPIGVLDVLERGHQLAEEVRAARPDLTEEVREFLRRTYSPLRSARMLRYLNPADESEAAALSRFVEILPDTAVLALFEGISREGDSEQYQPLLRFVCARIEDRLIGWLNQASQLPAEQLVPIVDALRIADIERHRSVRPMLLRSTSGRVRASVLDWYGAALPAEEVRNVAAMLLDRVPAVRDSAARTLVRHRPAEAVRLLTKTLRSDAFAELDADRKAEMCTTFGRLAGPTGLPLLNELLNTKLGFLRDDEANATVSAAALGLAAMGSPNAVMALEKGARGFNGVRKNACQAALAVMEAERMREAARG